MGLLYIAAHLERHGVPVEVVDLSGRTGWTIPPADIYGITSYVSTLDITEKIAAECKTANPCGKIVVGGAHATARPQDFPYADHVVQGRGESPMLALCGKQTPAGPFIFPAYHLTDIASYSRTIAGKPSLPFLTSRGCPFKCTFCGLASMHGLDGFSMAPVDTVANHIRRIKDEFGVDRLNIQDDIFTLNRPRLFEILKHIKALGIRFRCMGRAGYDTEETYERLAEAGCDSVAWGIESGSQRILDRMGKEASAEDNYNVIQWAKRYGITARAFFIIGFPGETYRTLEETKRFIERADPDQWFVSNFIPYPGTKVGDNPTYYGITYISPDKEQFYQVSKDGTGGITIDTHWLTRDEFRALEIDFRGWLSKRPMRGILQDYEKRSNLEQDINRYSSVESSRIHAAAS